MPFRYEQTYVEPEQILEHNGVSIYRVYDDLDVDNPQTYWFTTYPNDSDAFADDHEFNIRELPEFAAVFGDWKTLGDKIIDPKVFDERRNEILKAAIDSGNIKKGW